MPELPEVQTTVNGINETVKGLKIVNTWTNYNSAFHTNKDNIKDPKYFAKFATEIIDAEIVGARRLAKNILIDLDSGKTILIHMKMTGHIMFGSYELSKNKEDFKDPWKPAATETEALRDPFNRHIRLVFSLKNKKGVIKQLVLSDMRKFAKVTLIETKDSEHNPHLSHLGPEPLSETFTFKVFRDRLSKKPNGPIKSILMDQSLISGIGNIYSDEALWLAGIHPEEKVKTLLEHKHENLLKKLHTSNIAVLKKGIDFGGDSMSDYRNIKGERGKFQGQHNAYRKTGTACKKKGCEGIILRKVVRTRSAHFCSAHQQKIK